jgi:hypothetical protein
MGVQSTEGIHRRPLPFPRWAILAIIIVVCLSSCDSAFKQADLESFVSTGLTMVALHSSSYSSTTSVGSVPSGSPVTCTLAIINPKSFDVAYTLGWNVDNSLFTTLPSAAPTASDATHLQFSFALDPTKAERKTITFSLGKYVASINKTYDTDSFSVVCESPPDPPSRVATVIDSSQKSILAIMLPTGTADGDLSKLQITWTQVGGSGTSESGTYAISSLQKAPSPNPFASKYDCYFQSSDVVAGYGYTYSVALINAEGIKSSAATAASTANQFYLNYNGNGNTGGTVTSSVGYRFGATATVASVGTLAKTNYAFSKWNTAADGTGTSYSPGDTLTIPAGETTLYAQWITNATTISFDIGTQALSFSQSAVSVKAGNTLSVSCANSTLTASGTNWAWYLDGSLLSGQTSSTFSWTPTSAGIGQHIVSCTVTFNGIGYSGSFRATVTQQ